MKNRILSVPAIHDWHLEDVLQELGISDLLLRGDGFCGSCGRAISHDNLGAIFVAESNEYRFVCHEPRCLAKAATWTS